MSNANIRPDSNPAAEQISPDASFDEFFTTTRDHVVGLIAIMTRDVGSAEDAAQEAYARAYRNWKRVGALDRPDLWVVRVGRHIAIDSWRKHNREHVLQDRPRAPAEDRVQSMWVRWGLDHLTARQREVVILYYAHGLNREEVAARIGATKSTVKTHLERARLRLRQVLKGDVGR